MKTATRVLVLTLALFNGACLHTGRHEAPGANAERTTQVKPAGRPDTDDPLYIRQTAGGGRTERQP